MEKTLANLPVNALSEIMGKLSLKNATSLGSASRSTRALLERTHPKRYKGPPDYTKGKGKYQKEYDQLEETMKNLLNTIDNSSLTIKRAVKLRQEYFLRDHALERAKEAYAHGNLLRTMTRYWKKAARLKEVYKGVIKQLETMGEAYEPAVHALKKNPKESVEDQSHRIMDGLVKYLPRIQMEKK